MQADRSENTTSVVMPDFQSIPVKKWMAGETPIRRILKCVRPTYDCEVKRNDAVWYIQQLIQKNISGVKVLRYGSVPLKTYLPDGDVDLSVVSNIPYLECELLRVVYDILQAEIYTRNGGGMLKEAQAINAKVKLIKCVFDDIIIDISFNQMSGIYALCFLDQVDLYIQRDHLFKRSIILIKSWCYHESRIMGAVHGLISTYALETLVLYIFRMYDTSLESPLMVLYRFLEYYSKFDWTKFAVSINGPVDLSLLSFKCNIINIVDPLKESNNIGASVHSGTFSRITIALDRGARKLGKILELPKKRIPEEIHDFFRNTVRMYPSRLHLNPRRFADLSGNHVENERNLLAVQCNEGYPYSPLFNHQVNWAHRGSHEVGGSSGASNNGHEPSNAPCLVHTPDTKLKFGSFDPDFMTSIEPEPTEVRLRGRRVQDTPLPLTIDAIKLSPLATMINTLVFWFKH